MKEFVAKKIRYQVADILIKSSHLFSPNDNLTLAFSQGISLIVVCASMKLC